MCCGFPACGHGSHCSWPLMTSIFSGACIMVPFHQCSGIYCCSSEPCCAFCAEDSDDTVLRATAPMLIDPRNHQAASASAGSSSSVFSHGFCAPGTAAQADPKALYLSDSVPVGAPTALQACDATMHGLGACVGSTATQPGAFLWHSDALHLFSSTLPFCNC